MNLDSKTFLELAREIIGQDARLRFRVHGYSMFPFIKDGDVIHVKPARPDHITSGDVIFYSRGNRFAVAHRAIGSKKEGGKPTLIARSDNALKGSFETIQPEQLLGKVFIVERKGKRKRLDRGLQKILGMCWTNWPTLLRNLYKILKTFSKLPEIFDSRFYISSPEKSLQSVVKKYDNPDVVEYYSRIADDGLNEEEKYMLNKHLEKKGHVLIIGCGAGREAFTLTRLGHKVTGIDFVPGMVQQARQHAKRNELDVKFEVRGAAELSYPSRSFDYVFFSEPVFSNIPTRRLRVKLLKDIKRIIKPRGILFFSVFYRHKGFFSWFNVIDSLRWLASVFFRRNFDSQLGDAMRGRIISPASDTNRLSFYHYFSGDKEVLRELKSAGLTTIEKKGSYWAVKQDYQASLSQP